MVWWWGWLGQLIKVDNIVTVLFYIFLYSLSLTGNTSDNHLTYEDSTKNKKRIHETAAKAEQLSTSSSIPSYYIHVIEEPNEQLLAHDKELARRVDGAMGNSDHSSEVYEKTLAKHRDKAFYKFHKRIARCTEQILR